MDAEDLEDKIKYAPFHPFPKYDRGGESIYYSGGITKRELFVLNIFCARLSQNPHESHIPGIINDSLRDADYMLKKLMKEAP